MAFSAHTGEYGAEWYFLDPQNLPPNNPGVTVDFRAFLLATGGINAAEEHFRECMDAFGIHGSEGDVRVSRVDFAVDLLAPWFEPCGEALVVPPGTRKTEYTGVDETGTVSSGASVIGLRAGQIANRQLVIYDKRLEIMSQGKMGWLPIWNAALAKAGLSPLCLDDPNTSRVWRFELRMGSRQLRNRWEMRSWQELRERVGDAYAEFCERITYTQPTADSNRSRWPVHPLWEQVVEVVNSDLLEYRIGVLPDLVKTVNRDTHMEMLDRQILGLMVSRAAAAGIQAGTFEDFVQAHPAKLLALSERHPRALRERMVKAEGKYRFK